MDYDPNEPTTKPPGGALSRVVAKAKASPLAIGIVVAIVIALGYWLVRG